MRPLRYQDAQGFTGNATLVVEGGRLHILCDQQEAISFVLSDFRGAMEMEAFEKGPVIPGGPGAKVGRRKVAA